MDGTTVLGFYSTESVTIPASGSNTIPVAEGTFVQDEVLSTRSDGGAFQRYALSFGDVVIDSILVNVLENGVTLVPYFRSESIVGTVSSARVFRTREDADGFTEVYFGGGGGEIVPPSGAKVMASYAYSSGSAGNIAAGLVTAFDERDFPDLSITGSSAMAGGRNEEPIRSPGRRVRGWPAETATCTGYRFATGCSRRFSPSSLPRSVP